MFEADPKEQGTPQERMEDHVLGADSDEPAAESGADSASDAAKAPNNEE